MASRSLGVLTVDLVAKVAGFEQGMDRAASTADKRMSQIEKRAKIAGKALGSFLVAGATTLATSIQLAINRMDDLSKAAQRAQLPTEQFSQLAYAADLADVSMDNVVTSFGRLARAQLDAARGSKEQADAFERLGIEFKNADGSLRDSTEVFRDFADVYQKFQGTPEVLASGMQIFGRSFQNLIPLLKDGGDGLAAAAEEADRLGYTISTEAGRQAEEFNDNLTRLKTVVMGLSNAIAADLLPDLVRLTGGFVDSAKEGNRLKETASDIADAIRGFVNWMNEGSKVGASFRQSMRDLNEVIGAVGANISGIFSLDQGMIDQSRRDAIEAGKRFWNSAVYGVEQGKKENPLINFITADEGSIPESAKLIRNTGQLIVEPPETKAKRSGGKSDAQRAAEEALKAQQEAEKALREQIEAVADAREEFDALAAQLAGPLAAAAYQFSVEQQRLNDLAATGEVTTEELASAQANLRKEYDETVKAINAQLTQAEEGLKYLQEETMWLLANEEGQRRLAAARLLGADATAAQVEEAARLLELNERIAEQSRYWEDVQRSMSDALFDFATGAKSATDALGSFLDALFAESIRALSEEFSKSITEIFKSASGSGANGQGGWGALFSAIGGFFGGGKAGGGWASPNTMYEVNERGLEMATVNGRDYLLTGSSGANITPAGQWGGGVNISMVNNFDRNNSGATPEQIAVRTGQNVQRQMARTGR